MYRIRINGEIKVVKYEEFLELAKKKINILENERKEEAELGLLYNYNCELIELYKYFNNIDRINEIKKENLELIELM